MFSSVRKTITIIFTLVSFGIIFNTSPVLADTTSPDQTDSSIADDQVTISGIQMPYTTFVSKSGERQKHYWLPNSEDPVTVKNILDNKYDENLANSYNDDPIYKDAAATIIAVLHTCVWTYWENPVTITPNETLLDAVQTMMSQNNYLDNIIYQVCLTRDLVRYQIGVPFSLIQPDYDKYLKSGPEPDTMKSDLKKAFSSEDEFQDYSNTLDLPSGLIFQGLYGVPQSDIARIDLESTRTLMETALNKRFANYFVSQDDGTYVTGNISFIQQAPYIYGLGDLPTDTTNPKPAPATSQPVTIHYVDSTGKTLKPDKTLTGSLGSHYTATPLAITGYTLSQTTGEETGTFDTTAKTITYTYTKDPLADVDGLAPKNTVIYATKKIGLYRQATFTKQARKQWYAKKSRINRPMFVVTGYAKSKNGVKRYYVKDVNHSSKTNGQTGYVTANAKYVAHVYYATKHQRVTVINPQGVNAYSQKNLTGQAAHYQQGQVLKVKRIVRHNLTTRFVLSNGRYITANKSLVQAGKVTIPSRVRAKGALNRYTDVQLTRKNRHYSKKASATFTVKGWAYTNANNFGKRDTLRYRVAGGYITGNRHLITVVK